MRILVTGSAGFIGGSVGRAAVRAGHDVLGLARRSQPEIDWPAAHLQADVAQSDLAGIIGDFRPEVVFHGAGTASVGGSLAAPLDDLRAALFTWANLLDGIRRARIRTVVVFPSSAAVYGDPSHLPVAEDAPVTPISPYGFHKAACELLAAEYAKCFGLNIVVGRIFSLFGERQRRLLVWELFDQLNGTQRTVSLHGTGAESRDFLHVDDFAAAVLQLTQTAGQHHGNGRLQTVNVGSGMETRVSELAEQLARLVAPEKQICYRGSPRLGDPRNWRADISQLQAAIPAWQPMALALGLSKCVLAWREQKNIVALPNL
jgi:UDP-glucose 4-epimerase